MTKSQEPFFVLLEALLWGFNKGKFRWLKQVAELCYLFSGSKEVIWVNSAFKLLPIQVLGALMLSWETWHWKEGVKMKKNRLWNSEIAVSCFASKCCWVLLCGFESEAEGYGGEVGTLIFPNLHLTWAFRVHVFHLSSAKLYGFPNKLHLLLFDFQYVQLVFCSWPQGSFK